MMEIPRNNSDFYVYRMDRCQNCGNQSLEIYDYFNNPMGYKDIATRFITAKIKDSLPESILNKRPFYTFRCKQCGKTYPIIWINGFPVPEFSASYVRDFISEFQSLNSKNKGKG